MKQKILLVALMLVLIVLDFAAMDDITTGSEPSYAMEYLTLIVSIPLFSILGLMFVRKEYHDTKRSYRRAN